MKLRERALPVIFLAGCWSIAANGGLLALYLYGKAPPGYTLDVGYSILVAGFTMLLAGLFITTQNKALRKLVAKLQPKHCRIAGGIFAGGAVALYLLYGAHYKYDIIALALFSAIAFIYSVGITESDKIRHSNG